MRVGGRCGDDEFTADTGAFIFLPRYIEHSLWVLGDEQRQLERIASGVAPLIA